MATFPLAINKRRHGVTVDIDARDVQALAGYGEGLCRTLVTLRDHRKFHIAMSPDLVIAALAPVFRGREPITVKPGESAMLDLILAALRAAARTDPDHLDVDAINAGVLAKFEETRDE